MEKNRYYFNFVFRFDLKNYQELWFNQSDFLDSMSFYTDDRSLISDENIKKSLQKIIEHKKINDILEIWEIIVLKNWTCWKFELLWKDRRNTKYSLWYGFIECYWTDELRKLEDLFKN